MGRHNKPASQLQGNHKSQAEKKRLVKFEQETVGASDRLEQGLDGLYDQELNQLRDGNAEYNYDILAWEAHKSSALGNIHISDLIDLANEMSLLKEYEEDIKIYKRIIFVGEKPVPNPAIKMRQDSLKTIGVIKSRLGLGAVDIVTLARQKAEMNETDGLTNLFTKDIAGKAFGEETTNEV
ncbi:hypothetical protein ABWK24_02425 [Priestia megaterium]|uniref:hypothetical protein n=1 Tax=Priestia megaterium TaxID=1404 RepID=UPI003395286B